METGATPLAALVHSRVGPLSLRDYGSCGKRAVDSSSLFVAAIGRDRNKGSDGWVYKAGNVLGTAGAAEPAGHAPSPVAPVTANGRALPCKHSRADWMKNARPGGGR